jgi:hypothetical protein
LSVDPQKVKHHINAIPGYSASWICNVASLYRHNGDLDFISSLHDSLVALTAYMKADLDSDLLFQNLHPVSDTPIMMYCDWCKGVGPNDDNAESRAITDLYYIQAYREAAYLLTQMGDSQNAAICEKLARDMTSSARRSYLSASGTYGERIQENTRAILAGVASPAQLPGIFANVFAPGSPGRVKPAASSLPRTITPYYLGFIFPVLSMLGHNDEAIALARTYCGGMLARGATTYWETFDPESKHDLGYGGSRCHAWSSGITSWLTEYVVGVRSTAPGYSRVEITPNLTGLTWASGDVPTPHGTIHVHASQSVGKMNLFIALPKGIAAHVGLPGKEVQVDGKSMPGEPGPGGRTFVSLTAPGEYVLSGE